MDPESANSDARQTVVLALSVIGGCFPSLDDTALEEVEVFDGLKRLFSEESVSDSAASVTRRLKHRLCVAVVEFQVLAVVMCV